jgi:hypothetical protein
MTGADSGESAEGGVVGEVGGASMLRVQKMGGFNSF